MFKAFPTISAILMLYIGLTLVFGAAIFGVIVFSIPMLPGIALLCVSDGEIGSKRWLYLLLGLILTIIGGFGALMALSVLIVGYH